MASMPSIPSMGHRLSNKPHNVEDLISLIVHHVTETVSKKSPASSREIIYDIVRTEVMAVIRSGHAGEDAGSIVELERRILHRLEVSDATSWGGGQLNEKTNVSMNMDEWAVLAKYAALQEHEEELQRAKDARLKAQEAQAAYLEHQEELKKQKMMEKRKKKEEWARVQADVSKWKEDEYSKKLTKRNVADAIKRDRETQLEGYRQQRFLAMLLRQASEAHALEILKNESKASLEAEKAARELARREMEVIFEKNRAAKQAQLDAKLAEQEEDRRYMRLYAVMLDKQDAQRREQLEKIQNIQAQQVQQGVAPISDRRWIDDSVIEQQAASREVIESEKERERKAKEAESAEQCKREIAEQLKAKRALKARAQEEKFNDRKALEQITKQVKQEQYQRTMTLKAAKQKQQNELSDQIAARRMLRQSKSRMNSIEKKLNARRLQEATAAMQK